MPAVQGRMPATRRVLTLLALLAGLLAMHGLAAGPHAAHAAASLQGSHAMTGMGGAADLSAGLPAPAAVAPAGHRGPVMVAMALCLVVLVAVGATLLAPSLRSRTQRAGPVRLLPWRRTPSAPRGPPPDLLSQLCVLRT